MKNVFYSFVLLVLFAGTAVADRPSFKTLLSPIPIWPSDGDIPAQLNDKYVFLDPEAGQIVISYPESVTEYSSKGSSTPRQVKRFNLNNRVQTSVSVSVESNDGALIYKYQISNSNSAKEPVSRIKLATPPELQDTEVKVPNSWIKEVEMGYVAASSLGIGKTVGTIMTWSSVEKGVLPGHNEAGFELESSLMPGFTWAYAQNGVPLSLPADLPESVLVQAEPMLKLENNSQRFLTIGPKFGEKTPLLRIVAEYHFGINLLIREGELNENSPAVKESLEEMEKYLQAAREAGNVPLDEWVGPPLAFQAIPEEGLEKEILHALKLSVH